MERKIQFIFLYTKCEIYNIFSVKNVDMIITVFVGANLCSQVFLRNTLSRNIFVTQKIVCVRPKNKITFKIKFYAKNIKNMDMMYTVTIPPLSLVTPDSSPKGRAFFLENGYKKPLLLGEVIKKRKYYYKKEKLKF